MRKLYGKSSIYTMTGGCWHGEAGGELSRNETFEFFGLEAFWSSLVGPELEESKKITEAGNHCLSLDGSGVIAAEFVGQRCIVIGGLAIFCLYRQSLEHEKESVRSQAFLFII